MARNIRIKPQIWHLEHTSVVSLIPMPFYFSIVTHIAEWTHLAEQFSPLVLKVSVIHSAGLLVRQFAVRASGQGHQVISTQEADLTSNLTPGHILRSCNRWYEMTILRDIRQRAMATMFIFTLIQMNIKWRLTEYVSPVLNYFVISWKRSHSWNGYIRDLALHYKMMSYRLKKRKKKKRMQWSKWK